MAWHALPAEEVLAQLGARPTGLDAGEVAAWRKTAGSNSLPEPRRQAGIVVFLRQFKSPLVYLLLAAAAIATFVGELTDAGVIVGVLLTNAVIGAFQEGRAARSMEALRRLASVRVRVRREGAEALVEARDLVPGDILILGAGDAVAADARLLETAGLSTLEGSLTGESVPVPKSSGACPVETGLADRSSMVYAGTHVSAGRGVAVVASTGPATEVGRIAALTEGAVEPPTPLERRLSQLGKVLALASVAVFLVVLGVGWWRGLPWTQMLLVAISQLVSTVPEGLPVATTVALAVGMRRMAGRGALIRRLAAVESLGSTTVICTDKTGTLTRNEMTAVAAWLPGDVSLTVNASGLTNSAEIRGPAGPVAPGGHPALTALLEVAALCNDARLFPPQGAETSWSATGDPTEAALLALALQGGVDAEALGRRLRRSGEIPFDAAQKMMATEHENAGARVVMVKGAPEAVLALCGEVVRDGVASPLDEERRREVSDAAETLASRALRVLAFARVPGGLEDAGDQWRFLRGRAQFLGLVGQIDPPREDAGAAVRDCRRAGIRPVMVTGDHRLTAGAIAKQLDIARDGDLHLDGRELDRLPDDDLRREVGRVAVFARVYPEQKLRIVEALQARGEVVAMTGDGVNDAPALARAEVGVAMGRTGTDVAKQAADVVLTRDDFATIVAAVKEGRLVFANVRKALVLLLSTALAEVAVLLGSLVAGLPLPFAAVQILWNNVVTEGTITVNLAMEPAEGDEMARPPIHPSAPLLGRAELARLAWLGVVITAVTLGYFAWEIGRDTPLPKARTATFTLLALCEWANVVNVRSARRSALATPPWTNGWLLGGLLVSVGLQVAVLSWPPLMRLFHTVPLRAADVAILVMLGSLVFWAEEARKLLVRVRRRGNVR